MFCRLDGNVIVKVLQEIVLVTGNFVNFVCLPGR